MLVLWERVVGDLLDRTAKFPKVVRFTFAGRLDGVALDFLERIAEARWAPAPRRRGQEALCWAELLQRVFKVNGWECPHCQQPMALRTIVSGPTAPPVNPRRPSRRGGPTG